MTDTLDEPRHNEHAEQCVLGAMILDQNQIGEIEIASTDFYKPAHGTIHAMLTRMYRDGQVVDAVTLHQELLDAGEAGRVGGAPYLHTLTSVVPTAANGPHYAQIVKDEAARRRLSQVGQRILQLAAAEGDIEDLSARALAAFEAADNAPAKGPQMVADLVGSALDEIEQGGEHGVGVEVPWADVRRVMRSFRPGQLIVIGARPAVGKSVVGLDIARHAAFRQGKTALLFTLEMTKAEVTMRALAAEGPIPLTNVMENTMSDEHWEKVSKAIATFADHRLFVDDTFNLTIPMARAKARRIKAKHGLDLIVVDYLQLMTAEKADNRQEAVAQMSRGLKLMAKEFECPVVALSQLNRAVESRATKRPGMTDLRESGAIEQDADVILLLHRDDLHDKQAEHVGEMEIIIEKHRNGAIGSEFVAFQGHYARTSDLARPWTTQ